MIEHTICRGKNIRELESWVKTKNCEVWFTPLLLWVLFWQVCQWRRLDGDTSAKHLYPGSLKQLLLHNHFGVDGKMGDRWSSWPFHWVEQREGPWLGAQGRCRKAQVQSLVFLAEGSSQLAESAWGPCELLPRPSGLDEPGDWWFHRTACHVAFFLPPKEKRTLPSRANVGLNCYAAFSHPKCDCVPKRSTA